jgi:hypothetical protein
MSKRYIICLSDLINNEDNFWFWDCFLDVIEKSQEKIILQEDEHDNVHFWVKQFSYLEEAISFLNRKFSSK